MDHPLCLLRWQKPDYQIYKRNEPESDLTVSDLPHFPSLRTLASSCQTSGLKREENLNWINGSVDPAHVLTL